MIFFTLIFGVIGFTVGYNTLPPGSIQIDERNNYERFIDGLIVSTIGIIPGITVDYFIQYF